MKGTAEPGGIFLVRLTGQVNFRRKNIGAKPNVFLSYCCLSKANFNPNPIKTSPVA
jgi:hypothetical protein